MANSVPPNISKEIKRKVFAILDERHYLGQSRKKNGELMDELVADANIGGVLAEYIHPSSIKTYIKDAIINAYSKDVNSKLFSVENVENKLSIREKSEVHLIEGKYTDKVLFLRSDEDCLIIAGIGTILKWETALRKALEFIEKSPNLKQNSSKLKVYLLVSTSKKKITQSEINHITHTLSYINVSVELFE